MTRTPEDQLLAAVVTAANVYIGAKLYQLYQLKQTADQIKQKAEDAWDWFTDQ